MMDEGRISWTGVRNIAESGGQRAEGAPAFNMLDAMSHALCFVHIKRIYE
jgi:hypothetical protein